MTRRLKPELFGSERLEMQHVPGLWNQPLQIWKRLLKRYHPQEKLNAGIGMMTSAVKQPWKTERSRGTSNHGFRFKVYGSMLIKLEPCNLTLCPNIQF